MDMPRVCVWYYVVGLCGRDTQTVGRLCLPNNCCYFSLRRIFLRCVERCRIGRGRHRNAVRTRFPQISMRIDDDFLCDFFPYSQSFVFCCISCEKEVILMYATTGMTQNMLHEFYACNSYSLHGTDQEQSKIGCVRFSFFFRFALCVRSAQHAIHF